MKSYPAEWPPRAVEAWPELIEAIEEYELYAAALQRLNVSAASNPKLIQRRQELSNHIKTVLLPAFENA